MGKTPLLVDERIPDAGLSRGSPLCQARVVLQIKVTAGFIMPQRSSRIPDAQPQVVNIPICSLSTLSFYHALLRSAHATRFL